MYGSSNRTPRQPATAIERLVVNRLKQMRASPLNALVEAAARDIYLQELANGLSVSDIGVIGPAVFPWREAGTGTLWSVESSV